MLAAGGNASAQSVSKAHESRLPVQEVGPGSPPEGVGGQARRADAAGRRGGSGAELPPEAGKTKGAGVTRGKAGAPLGSPGLQTRNRRSLVGRRGGHGSRPALTGGNTRSGFKLTILSKSLVF